ncbi:Breast cancer 2, early onset [Rhizophlyctis rosea]|uniref:Breast cancer 2, early onset n=1 Tax=Rhizophlyctis rosea TaxID=64517 RepID=A0AAD5SB68_9FUNG|nr:Breast cancer 2, early onset [Rhizophlyctis rosea]
MTDKNTHTWCSETGATRKNLFSEYVPASQDEELEGEEFADLWWDVLPPSFTENVRVDQPAELVEDAAENQENVTPRPSRKRTRSPDTQQTTGIVNKRSPADITNRWQTHPETPTLTDAQPIQRAPFSGSDISPLSLPTYDRSADITPFNYRRAPRIETPVQPLSDMEETPVGKVKPKPDAPNSTKSTPISATFKQLHRQYGPTNSPSDRFTTYASGTTSGKITRNMVSADRKLDWSPSMETPSPSEEKKRKTPGGVMDDLRSTSSASVEVSPATRTAASRGRGHTLPVISPSPSSKISPNQVDYTPTQTVINPSAKQSPGVNKRKRGGDISSRLLFTSARTDRTPSLSPPLDDGPSIDSTPKVSTANRHSRATGPGARTAKRRQSDQKRGERREGTVSPPPRSPPTPVLNRGRKDAGVGNAGRRRTISGGLSSQEIRGLRTWRGRSGTGPGTSSPLFEPGDVFGPFGGGSGAGSRHPERHQKTPVGGRSVGVSSQRYDATSIRTNKQRRRSVEAFPSEEEFNQPIPASQQEQPLPPTQPLTNSNKSTTPIPTKPSSTPHNPTSSQTHLRSPNTTSSQPSQNPITTPPSQKRKVTYQEDVSEERRNRESVGSMPSPASSHNEGGGGGEERRRRDVSSSPLVSSKGTAEEEEEEYNVAMWEYKGGHSVPVGFSFESGGKDVVEVGTPSLDEEVDEIPASQVQLIDSQPQRRGRDDEASQRDLARDSDEVMESQESIPASQVILCDEFTPAGRSAAPGPTEEEAVYELTPTPAMFRPVGGDEEEEEVPASFETTDTVDSSQTTAGGGAGEDVYRFLDDPGGNEVDEGDEVHGCSGVVKPLGGEIVDNEVSSPELVEGDGDGGTAAPRDHVGVEQEQDVGEMFGERDHVSQSLALLEPARADGSLDDLVSSNDGGDREIDDRPDASGIVGSGGVKCITSEDVSPDLMRRDDGMIVDGWGDAEDEKVVDNTPSADASSADKPSLSDDIPGTAVPSMQDALDDDEATQLPPDYVHPVEQVDMLGVACRDDEEVVGFGEAYLIDDGGGDHGSVSNRTVNSDNRNSSGGGSADSPEMLGGEPVVAVEEEVASAGGVEAGEEDLPEASIPDNSNNEVSSDDRADREEVSGVEQGVVMGLPLNEGVEPVPPPISSPALQSQPDSESQKYDDLSTQFYANIPLTAAVREANHNDDNVGGDGDDDDEFGSTQDFVDLPLTAVVRNAEEAMKGVVGEEDGEDGEGKREDEEIGFSQFGDLDAVASQLLDGGDGGDGKGDDGTDEMDLGGRNEERPSELPCVVEERPSELPCVVARSPSTKVVQFQSGRGSNLHISEPAKKFGMEVLEDADINVTRKQRSRKTVAFDLPQGVGPALLAGKGLADLSEEAILRKSKRKGSRRGGGELVLSRVKSGGVEKKEPRKLGGAVKKFTTPFKGVTSRRSLEGGEGLVSGNSAPSLDSFRPPKVLVTGGGDADGEKGGAEKKTVFAPDTFRTPKAVVSDGKRQASSEILADIVFQLDAVSAEGVDNAPQAGSGGDEHASAVLQKPARFSSGSGKTLAQPSEIFRKEGSSVFAGFDNNEPVGRGDKTPEPVIRSAGFTLGGGFTSGGGKALGKVSDASLKRVAAMTFAGLEEVGNEGDVGTVPALAVGGFSTGGGKVLRQVTETDVRKGLGLLEGSEQTSGEGTGDDNRAPMSNTRFGGFGSASGKELPPLTVSSKKKGKAVMDSAWTGDGLSVAGETTLDVTPKLGGFSTGRMRAMPPVSAANAERGLAVLNGGEGPNDGNVGVFGVATEQFKTPSKAPRLGGFSAGSGRVLSALSEAALSEARGKGLLDGEVEDGKESENVGGDAPVSLWKAELGEAPKLGGFGSASGKKLGKVSSLKQTEAARWLEGGEDVALPQGDLIDWDAASCPDRPTIGGFGSGSGKRLGKVSAHKQAEAARWLEDAAIGAGSVVNEVTRAGPDPSVVGVTEKPDSKTADNPFVTPETPVKRTTPKNVGRASDKTPAGRPLHAHLQRIPLAMQSMPPSDSAAVAKKPVSLFDLDARDTLRQGLGNVGGRLSVEELREAGVSCSPDEIIFINPANAEGFRFRSNNESEQSIGKEEFAKRLYESGANPNLATDVWIANHYKWIVWKLAAIVRCTPQRVSEVFNEAEVLRQLLYRYEREINRAQRSALKAIIERDDTPAKQLVLCVSAVFGGSEPAARSSEQEGRDQSQTPSTSISLEVTDGWYHIRASLDEVLQKCVRDGKIYVGQKLRICGAQLTGPVDARPALEVGTETQLRLVANGTRRARWDAKLGYQRERHFGLGIPQLAPGGGAVPYVDVVVTRRYPVMYMDRLVDGSRITRNAKEEEVALRAWQDAFALKYQKHAAAIDKESAFKPPGTAKRIRRRLPMRLSDLDSGPELLAEMSRWHDSESFMTQLTPRQSRILNEYMQGRESKRQEDVHHDIQSRVDDEFPPREVFPLLRLRVCDYPPASISKSQTAEALLTIWRPNQAQLDGLQEGKRYRFYNLIVKEARNPRFAVSLNSQGVTQFMEKPVEAERLEQCRYVPRQYVAIEQLHGVAQGEEVDLVLLLLDQDEIKIRYQSTETGLMYYGRNLLCTDASGRVAVIDVRSIVESHVQFQIDSVLIFRNLEFVYYDQRLGFYKLKLAGATEIRTMARNDGERRLVEGLTSWMKSEPESFSYIKLAHVSTLHELQMWTGGPHTPAKYTTPARTLPTPITWTTGAPLSSKRPLFSGTPFRNIATRLQEAQWGTQPKGRSEVHEEVITSGHLATFHFVGRTSGNAAALVLDAVSGKDQIGTMGQYDQVAAWVDDGTQRFQVQMSTSDFGKILQAGIDGLMHRSGIVERLFFEKGEGGNENGGWHAIFIEQMGSLREKAFPECGTDKTDLVDQMTRILEQAVVIPEQVLEERYRRWSEGWGVGDANAASLSDTVNGFVIGRHWMGDDLATDAMVSPQDRVPLYFSEEEWRGVSQRLSDLVAFVSFQFRKGEQFAAGDVNGVVIRDVAVVSDAASLALLIDQLGKF